MNDSSSVTARGYQYNFLIDMDYHRNFNHLLFSGSKFREIFKIRVSRNTMS